jgi:hypothetical protein
MRSATSLAGDQLDLRRSAAGALALLLIEVGLIAPTLARTAAEPTVPCREGPQHIRLEGQFTTQRAERFYFVCARAGQWMTVRITPLTRDLDTEGNVRYPSGSLEPGAPGGLVFDERLPENGIYRVRVGQRFNERHQGRFALDISLH